MACFLIGLTGPAFSAGGEALLGSVSDDPYDVRTYVRTIRPTGALAHVGTELVSTTEQTLAERGYFSCPGETGRGVNEAGLAFTIALLLEDETAPAPAPPTDFAELVERLMGHCETVNDGIALFQSAEAVSPAFTVLLADARGDLAHLEAGRFGVSVHRHHTRESPGVVSAVNCYLSPSLARYAAPAARFENHANNNLVRRERGKQLVEAERGPLGVEHVARILSDHANRERDPTANPLCGVWGYSICNHGTRGLDTAPAGDLPWGSVSGEILQPAACALWYAYGWPCGEAPEHGDQRFQERSWGRFVPFGLGDGADEATPLTTAEGEITPAGMRARLDR